MKWHCNVHDLILFWQKPVEQNPYRYYSIRIFYGHKHLRDFCGNRGRVSGSKSGMGWGESLFDLDQCAFDLNPCEL